MSDVQSLRGKRIVVTRARAQAPALCERLERLGAAAIEFPTIRIVPVKDTRPLDQVIGRLGTYDWVIFTSVNGVASFWERLAVVGRGTPAFAGVRVAAIGPATAEALVERGVQPAFVPQEFVAEAIAGGLGEVTGLSILLPRAELARRALADSLAARGARVEEIAAYRTLPARPDAHGLAALQKGVDAITFTSSSTVRNFVELLDNQARTLLEDTLIACIGPITARTAREMGLAVGVVATAYTVEGLVRALVEYYREA